MKIVVKSDGKVVREKKTRNQMHLEVQKNTRAQIIPSKKAYNRKRDKKDYEEKV